MSKILLRSQSIKVFLDNFFLGYLYIHPLGPLSKFDIFGVNFIRLINTLNSNFLRGIEFQFKKKYETKC